ncbi:MAG: hypothetical protein NWQ09_07230 [Nonlabens sp.]|nr:hypothetical protein [Nonlabens sp.]
MKNILIIICLVLGTSITFAQRDREDKNDKIKALMVTHISKDLGLSAQEAEKFWPVFHDYNGRKDDLRGKKRKLLRDLDGRLDGLSESDAQKFISEMDGIDAEEARLERNSQNDIIKIIGAKRYILLKKSEMNFRRNMLEEFKDRKRGK